MGSPDRVSKIPRRLVIRFDGIGVPRRQRVLGLVQDPLYPYSVIHNGLFRSGISYEMYIIIIEKIRSIEMLCVEAFSDNDTIVIDRSSTLHRWNRYERS